MAAKKSSARKTSGLPTRVWKFAGRVEPESIETAMEILRLSNRYYNRLVEIERARHARFLEIRRRYAPELADLEAQWSQLDDAVAALYAEAKRGRQTHWQQSRGEKVRSLPPEFEARLLVLEAQKKAVSAAAKSHRVAFKALLDPAQKECKRRAKELAGEAGPRTKSVVNGRVLAQMLAESEWTEAWKEISRSDAEAHACTLAAREACGLYAGTYLSVEEAFQRAKRDSAPRPPSFKRFSGGGQIQVQIKDLDWTSLGRISRVSVERLEARPGASARSRMVRVRFDQSRDDTTRIVSAVCKLHREPPADAQIKWVRLVIRRVGARTTCLLQFVLEHADFALAKRPPGSRDAEHVYIGWHREVGGIRVAYWRGGEVLCPSSILMQAAHKESIQSAVDRLHGQAMRRIAKVATLSGQPLQRRPMASARWRGQIRMLCEAYARHVLGEESVDRRWRAWIADRKAHGLDLYAEPHELRSQMGGREAFAWWCWIWAKKDAHLQQLSADSGRRFENRRDAHYRREAIRIATEFRELTVDDYSIAKLKEMSPLAMPGDGKRDIAQSQLQAAAPGRFREILREVMGARCAPRERPGGASGGGSARGRKTKSGQEVAAASRNVGDARMPAGAGCSQTGMQVVGFRSCFTGPVERGSATPEDREEVDQVRVRAIVDRHPPGAGVRELRVARDSRVARGAHRHGRALLASDARRVGNHRGCRPAE